MRWVKLPGYRQSRTGNWHQGGFGSKEVNTGPHHGDQWNPPPLWGEAELPSAHPSADFKKEDETRLYFHVSVYYVGKI